MVDVARAGFSLGLPWQPRVDYLQPPPGCDTLAHRPAGAFRPAGRRFDMAHRRVALPRRVEPGDHDALILLTTRPWRSAGVAVRMRIGVVVVVRAPGRIVRSLAIRGLRVRRVGRARTLELALANGGNVTETIDAARVRLSFVRKGARSSVRAETRELRVPDERRGAVPLPGPARGLGDRARSAGARARSPAPLTDVQGQAVDIASDVGFEPGRRDRRDGEALVLRPGQPADADGAHAPAGGEGGDAPVEGPRTPGRSPRAPSESPGPSRRGREWTWRRSVQPCRPCAGRSRACRARHRPSRGRRRPRRGRRRLRSTPVRRRPRGWRGSPRVPARASRCLVYTTATGDRALSRPARSGKALSRVGRVAQARARARRRRRARLGEEPAELRRTRGRDRSGSPLRTLRGDTKHLDASRRSRRAPTPHGEPPWQPAQATPFAN